MFSTWWKAVQYPVPRKLNWSIGKQNSFQWVDEFSCIMAEIVCWKSGRLDRQPAATGVRSPDWLV